MTIITLDIAPALAAHYAEHRDSLRAVVVPMVPQPRGQFFRRSAQCWQDSETTREWRQPFAPGDVLAVSTKHIGRGRLGTMPMTDIAELGTVATVRAVQAGSLTPDEWAECGFNREGDEVNWPPWPGLRPDDYQWHATFNTTETDT